MAGIGFGEELKMTTDLPPWGDWFAENGQIVICASSGAFTIEDLFQNFKARLKDELEVTDWDTESFSRATIGELTER